MFTRHKSLAQAAYRREDLSRQLLTLVMQLHDRLLSPDEYERELEHLRGELPPWRVLNEHAHDDRRARFTVRHVATGEVLDEFEFLTHGLPHRLSFK